MSATSEQLAEWVAILNNAATWKQGTVATSLSGLAATIEANPSPTDLEIGDWAAQLDNVMGNFTGTRYDVLVEMYIDMETSAGDLPGNVLAITNVLVTAGLRIGLAQVIAEQILANNGATMSGVTTWGVADQTGPAHLTLADLTALAITAEQWAALGVDVAGAATAAQTAAEAYTDTQVGGLLPNQVGQPAGSALTTNGADPPSMAWGNLGTPTPPSSGVTVLDGGTAAAAGTTEILDGGTAAGPGSTIYDGGIA